MNEGRTNGGKDLEKSIAVHQGKELILLSGGLDSSVNFYESQSRGRAAMALTVDYGQRAAKMEIHKAREMCEKGGVPHHVLKLDFFKYWGSSSLTHWELPLPQGSEVQMEDLQISKASAKRVWVPNRNGVLLNIAAGWAESLGHSKVVVGFNKEEAMTFPDNSQDFISALNQSLSYSTSNGVEVVCYTTDMDKVEIARRGQILGMNWDEIWPCYDGGTQWCRVCESCQRTLRAMEQLAPTKMK